MKKHYFALGRDVMCETINPHQAPVPNEMPHAEKLGTMATKEDAKRTATCLSAMEPFASPHAFRLSARCLGSEVAMLKYEICRAPTFDQPVLRALFRRVWNALDDYQCAAANLDKVADNPGKM